MFQHAVPFAPEGERPPLRKQLTFPLPLLGLHLGTPCLWQLCQHPHGHAGRECRAEGGSQQIRGWQALGDSSGASAPAWKRACRAERGWSELLPPGRAGSRRLRAASLQKMLQWQFLPWLKQTQCLAGDNLFLLMTQI